MRGMRGGGGVVKYCIQVCSWLLNAYRRYEANLNLLLVPRRPSGRGTWTTCTATVMASMRQASANASESLGDAEQPGPPSPLPTPTSMRPAVSCLTERPHGAREGAAGWRSSQFRLSGSSLLHHKVFRSVHLSPLTTPVPWAGSGAASDKACASSSESLRVRAVSEYFILQVHLIPPNPPPPQLPPPPVVINTARTTLDSNDNSRGSESAHAPCAFNLSSPCPEGSALFPPSTSHLRLSAHLPLPHLLDVTSPLYHRGDPKRK